VRFVKAIKEAQRLGFTLEEIAEHARLTRRGDAHEAVRIRLAQKIDEVDARLASLRLVRDELAQVLGCTCDSLDHCTCGAAYLARGGRDPQLGPLLHVTNGESAGNTLRQTALGGAVLSWQDVLHEGPVSDVPEEELRRIRARFLSECGWGSERSLLDAFEAAGPARPARARGAHPGRPLVRARPLRPAAAPAGARRRAGGRRADPGVRSSRPARARRARGALAGPRARDGGGARARPRGAGRLPRARADRGRRVAAARHVHPTLPRLRVPKAARGAARLRERAHEDGATAARAAPRQASHAGRALRHASQEREEAAFAGDAWVWKRLFELRPLVGELPPPPPPGDARAFGRAQVTLTDLGREVLAGATDRLAVAPIDRWLGGTHLLGDPDWRWDAGSGSVRVGT
jgi:MerR, DNA binding